ncbi:hypothetical protein CDL15_Pgr024395 [Punica granatum]|uniref:Gnk2-homologous domain-containing protein n=1 Tax=Punica granatum TaxID=22663 RepID=A0A218XX65_PUNGR|nr:hypothetical protein CDL15_Pgr024395 [Punica granatum]PKI42683.1 hypothetical protein CRG98_036965 [Punica granatum]
MAVFRSVAITIGIFVGISIVSCYPGGPDTTKVSEVCNGQHNDDYMLGFSYIEMHLISETPLRGYSYYIASPWEFDIVYGHAACRGELSDVGCNVCLNSAFDQLYNDCSPMPIGAQIQLQDCRVRHMNTSDKSHGWNFPKDYTDSAQAKEKTLPSFFPILSEDQVIGLCAISPEDTEVPLILRFTLLILIKQTQQEYLEPCPWPLRSAEIASHLSHYVPVINQGIICASCISATNLSPPPPSPSLETIPSPSKMGTHQPSHRIGSCRSNLHP